MGYSFAFNPLSGSFDTVQNLQTVRAPDNAFIPPTGAAVFSDTFTEASTTLLNAHVPTTGTSWSLALSTGGATYTIPAGAGYVRPTTGLNNVGCLYLANNLAPAAAVEVSVRMPITVASTATIGLVFRYVDANNFYLLTISSTVGNCILYKKVAGVWTNLGTTSSGAVNGQTWRVRAVGTNIVVYANNTIVKITSDSSISAAGLCGLSAGAIGQNATDDTSTAWQVDDFTVTNYASAGGIVTTGINVIGDVQASGQIVGHGNNSPAYPAITFANDTNTGFYVSAADNLSIATGGSTRGTFNSAGLSISGVCYTSAGSAGAPSHAFGADSNTGFYNYAADAIGISTAGTLKWIINSSGVLSDPNASVPAVGNLDIATNGVVSNSGGNSGGFLVFSTGDYTNTYFRSDSGTTGAGLYGEGKLYFVSGTDYTLPFPSGIDFYIAATNYDSTVGDFNLTFGIVSGTNGGNINLYGGESNSMGTGGAVNISGGTSADSSGGAIYISAGSGLSGADTSIYGGYASATSGGTLYLYGGNSGVGSSGYGGTVLIQGGDSGIGDKGPVIIQPTNTGNIGVFGSSGSTQLTTAITPSTVSFGTGTTVTDDTTYDGYTIGQIVAALRVYGWLA